MWKEEASLIPAAYEPFGDRLPEGLWREYEALVDRLERWPAGFVEIESMLRQGRLSKTVAWAESA